MRVWLGYMYRMGRQVARKNSSVWRSSSGRTGCSKLSSGLLLSEDPGTYGAISSFLLSSQYACKRHAAAVEIQGYQQERLGSWNGGACHGPIQVADANPAFIRDRACQAD